MRVAGIQPGYLPWLGYFDQMRRVDAFIVADEMQFTSSGWAHRNRVRSPQGAHWLTVPVHYRLGEPICAVRLSPYVAWAERHLELLENFYRRSRFRHEILDPLASLLLRPATRLVEVTIPLLFQLRDWFGITTPLLVSSELGLEQVYAATFPEQPSPTHRIVAFLRHLGATSLLQGESARSYLDVDLCRRYGIKVEFHRYAHPEYPQLFSPFVSHLSVVDLLLCCGIEGARNVLFSVP
ncbi:MAG: WbqC family protein [Candidatus Binatia bacterium]|nr:WbqC family protein [Candidatus Binatia bacterium]